MPYLLGDKAKILPVKEAVDCGSLIFFFSKLLHAKPKHTSGKVASREKLGRKPEKKYGLNPLL